MFDSKLPMTYYKDVAVLNSSHGLYIVQHVETGKIYLKKLMHVYNMDVFEQLYKHPVHGIPRIYAMYEADGVLTVIEEYISGDTLQEILDIHGPVNETSAVRYAMLLCDILSSLHEMHPPIVHRDVKPSNIILTEDERIVLIDLNAARLDLGDKSQDTMLIGTKGYAAPEQYGFGQSTAKSDIYAVGRLLNELLGRTSASEAYNNSVSEAKHRISSPSRVISGRLQAIIDRCLAMDPNKRFSSAKALKKALQGCK